MILWTQLVPALEKLSTKQLRQRYAELFGESTNANNRIWLLRRIAWRLQAQAEGGLSERAKKRALELANDADLRLSPPTPRGPKKSTAPITQAPVPSSDRRLPVPGTLLCRSYKSKQVRAKVLAEGIEYEGKIFPSLSAVAKAITGSHTNGFLFFRLGQYQGARS
jgi:hypothetical protein